MPIDVFPYHKISYKKHLNSHIEKKKIIFVPKFKVCMSTNQNTSLA